MAPTDDFGTEFSEQERAEIAARADYLAKGVFQRVLELGFNSPAELQSSIETFLDKIPALVERLERLGPVSPPFDGGDDQREGPDKAAFEEGEELIEFIRARIETEIIRVRRGMRAGGDGEA